jgi:hypothetical protein
MSWKQWAINFFIQIRIYSYSYLKKCSLHNAQFIQLNMMNVTLFVFDCLVEDLKWKLSLQICIWKCNSLFSFSDFTHSSHEKNQNKKIKRKHLTFLNNDFLHNFYLNREKWDKLSCWCWRSYTIIQYNSNTKWKKDEKNSWSIVNIKHICHKKYSRAVFFFSLFTSLNSVRRRKKKYNKLWRWWQWKSIGIKFVKSHTSKKNEDEKVSTFLTS